MIFKGLGIKDFKKVTGRKAATPYTTFDGVNEYVSIGDSTSFNYDIGDTFSCSAWVYISSYKTDFIIAKYNQPTLMGWFFAISATGALAFSVQNNGNIKGIQVLSPVSAVPLNQWTLLTASYDASGLASGIELRIDNVVQAKTVTFDNLAGNSFTTLIIPRIGVDTSTNFFLGGITNAAIFNTVLSTSDIATIHSLGYGNDSGYSIPGVVSHYILDSLNPKDKKGINDGTSVNMDSTNIINPIPNQYPNQYAMSFDGVNEYISVPTSTSFDFLDEPRTISIRVYPKNNNGSIATSRTATSPNNGFFITQTTGVLLISTASVLGGQARISVPLLPLNQWNHLVITWDGSFNASGFGVTVNGVTQATTVLIDTFTPTTSTNGFPLWIGKDVLGGSLYYGDMSYLRLWSKELTPTEVLNDYNNGIPAEPLADNLLVNIDMGDGSTFNTNWILENRTGLTADGTSVNMDLTNRINLI